MYFLKALSAVQFKNICSRFYSSIPHTVHTLENVSLCTSCRTMLVKILLCLILKSVLKLTGGMNLRSRFIHMVCRFCAGKVLDHACSPGGFWICLAISMLYKVLVLICCIGFDLPSRHRRKLTELSCTVVVFYFFAPCFF